MTMSHEFKTEQEPKKVLIHIIGNGYDIQEGYETKFQDFLKKEQKNKELLSNPWGKDFLQIYRKESSEPLWCNFEQEIYKAIKELHIPVNTSHMPSKKRFPHLQQRFLKEYAKPQHTSTKHGIKAAINNIYSDLRCFTRLFHNYLVRNVRVQKDSILNELKQKTYPDSIVHSKVINFNYTKTFEAINSESYINENHSLDIYHVHGVIGDSEISKEKENEMNLVLGCQSFDPADKIDPAWNVFTKNHQRYLYGTIEKYQELPKELSRFKCRIAFCIIGHSLDRPDHVLLKHILCSSYNTAVRNSLITVYYHDEEARLRLINNIIDIIGEEDVMNRVTFLDQKSIFIDNV